MNDLSLDREATADSDQSTSKFAGAMLKDAREAQGLHIAALAVALKVPVRKLDALEAGKFDQLPDIVFVRALALSVCRALKVDPAPIMSSLPEPHFNQFKVNETGLNTTFKDAPGTSRRGLLAQVSSPIGLGVLLLVVAIVAILAWPVKPLFEDEPQASKEAAEQMPVMEQPVEATQVSTSVSDGVAQPTTALLAAPVVADVPASTVAKVLSVAVAVSASSPVSVSSTEVVSQPTVLELSGHGESWVEVTDSTGQSKLRKLIQSGEVIRLTGPLPLSVVVGRVDNVTVAIRGKPMDLTALARENVARFEVK